MAYRRRHGRSSSSTFMDETTTTSPPAATPNNHDHDHSSYNGSTNNNRLNDAAVVSNSSSSSSLAAQAIRASAAHRDSSHSSAYTNNYLPNKGGGPTYDYTSMGSSNEAAGISSFWGVLARKAKAILDDDVPYQPTEYGAVQVEIMTNSSNSKKTDANNPPTIRKGIDAFTTKMNRIGDTIGNAFEEGRTIVENKTADLIQETRKLQINGGRNINGDDGYSVQSPRNKISLTTQDDQIKASRDVAMATAAKAKLLLRELKTIKADLTFAKQRCSQLEEENKILRDARHHNAGGVHPEEDEMIRLQLETLLAEKSRLANENSVYARENRFLREIVEYHQLTMQDVVYIDEGIEEVTEVYPPGISRRMSMSPPSPRSPSSPSALSRSSTASRTSSVSLTLSLNKDNLINMQLPPRDAVINPNIHRSDSLPILACASQRGN